jgi:Tol biopolymer transport system component
VLAAALGCDSQAGVRGDPSQGLVFVQRDGQALELARARLADGAVRTLWHTPERDESWPTWSQVAQRLAFQVGRTGPDARSDLWIWRPGDAQAAPIAETPRRDEAWPSWSPVAPQLAFAFRGGSNAPGVALAAFGDGAPVAAPVAEAPAHTWFLRPRFAPDGLSLVAQRRAPRESQLWILERAGGGSRALTRDPAWFDLKAAFTRDGTRVLFTRRPAGGGPADIASVDREGGALRLHASTQAADDQSATPSPTRDEFAFVSDRDGSYELYVAPLDGGPARRLTDTPDRDEGAPHWSPDGERLVFTVAPREGPAPRARSRDALEHARIRAIDREGRLLFDAPGVMPDWMPPW